MCQYTVHLGTARGHPYHLPSINSTIIKAVYYQQMFIFAYVRLCEISWTIYSYMNCVFKVFYLLILLVYFVSVMFVYILIFTFKSTITYAL